MTGKQLIEAIQKYHLEDLDIFHAVTGLWQCPKLVIEFDDGSIDLPYPEYKDVIFDAPAYIYKYKVLEIDNEGNSKCYGKELDTRK